MNSSCRIETTSCDVMCMVATYSVVVYMHVHNLYVHITNVHIFYICTYVRIYVKYAFMWQNCWMPVSITCAYIGELKHLIICMIMNVRIIIM